MTTTGNVKKEKILEAGIDDMHLENGGDSQRERSGRLQTAGLKRVDSESDMASPRDSKMKVESRSPAKPDIESPTSDQREELIGAEVTLKMEPGQPPKLARSASQKIVAGPPRLFREHPSKTEEARKTFSMLAECTYASKYIGSTEHDSMECDCNEEWDAQAQVNKACGEESDCINRATKMECVGDCGCGIDCQNQRFQRQQFANVTVIQTEKKGYGLRTNTDLAPNQFIYEYIGEVINEGQFRKRMIQYDEEGIKHFYFMSLNKGEFVDATKRGNYGRFCNHSCNPNCYVDKWVVGEKLRMGIFAERQIKAGEELVFNYNVDRYGADPQPCYCGEPNCTGFIGGKTQTERATKLPQATIEALGIDDGDGWDTAVAKKPRKKKVGEDDEEYVNNVQARSLDENGVTKVMATLMQCKEKWIVVKLLDRIRRCEDERVRHRVVKMHGYQILNSTLSQWKEDANIVLQIFDVLDDLPRITRNKIQDSKIDTTVESLVAGEHLDVRERAQRLISEWSVLEVAYRIPRKKRDPTAGTPDKSVANRFGRRDSSRDERKPRSVSPKSPHSRSRSRSADTPKGPSASTGSRGTFSQRPNFYSGPRPPFRPRPYNALPTGWFAASDQSGRQYYYDASGKTTWERPTQPAAPPPPPPKPTSTNKALEDIINEITNAKANTPKEKVVVSSTPQPSVSEKKKEHKGEAKWRALPEEKQKRLYENTLFPHIKSVMDKYKNKLPKDDLKRFAKEISKKLVNSDYKNSRVQDPTKISEKQQKNVKKYVKDFFDRAVEKDKERQKRRALKKASEAQPSTTTINLSETAVTGEDIKEEAADLSEDGDVDLKLESTTPMTPQDPTVVRDGLKRKRDPEDVYDDDFKEDPGSTPKKRLTSESPSRASIPVPPPPPSAPPANGTTMQLMSSTGLDHDTESMNVDDVQPDQPAFILNGTPPPPPSDSPVRMSNGHVNKDVDQMMTFEGDQQTCEENEPPTDVGFEGKNHLQSQTIPG